MTSFDLFVGCDNYYPKHRQSNHPVCVCVCVLPLDLRDYKILLSRQAFDGQNWI